MKRFNFAKILLLIVLVASASSGQDLSNLRQQREQNQKSQRAQEARIAALNRDLNNLDTVTASQLSALKKLQAEIQKMQARRASLSEQIARLDTQKKQAEIKVKRLERELVGLKSRLTSLLQNLHRERAARYLPLLRAQSFTDLAVRSHWVGVLGETQSTLIQSISSTRQNLQDESVRLSLLVKDLNQAQAENTRSLSLLKKAQNSVKLTITDIGLQRQGRQVLLRESIQAKLNLRRDMQTLQRQIIAEAQRQAEIRRKAEEERRRRAAAEAARIRANQGNNSNNYNDNQGNTYVPGRATLISPNVPRALVGSFAFPVPGGRVAESYGFEGQTYQVIEGPTDGSKVVAAANGAVENLVYHPNLGIIVTIRHSDSLLALYSNLQDVRVQINQSVTKGQVIGYTGAAAMLPRSQMYFVVAIGGQEVDPSRFF